MRVFGKRAEDGKHFTYSKMMAWVAFDRAIKAAGMLHAGAPVERWQKVRTKIHDEICSHAYNEKLGSFVQSYGSEQLDASLLLMPMTGFLPPKDPRVSGTLKAIERQPDVRRIGACATTPKKFRMASLPAKEFFSPAASGW